MNPTTNKSNGVLTQPVYAVRQIATKVVAAIAGPAVSANIEIVGDQQMTTSWTFGGKSGSPAWQR